MKKRKVERTLAVVIVVLAVLAFRPPPFLDQVRYLAGDVFLRPAAHVVTRFVPSNHATSDAEELQFFVREAMNADRIGRDVFVPTDGLLRAPVLWSDRRGHYLVVGRGRRDGLRRGDRVIAGPALAGFVDRVEDHLARIRRLGHPDCYFVGCIVGEKARTHRLSVENREAGNDATGDASPANDVTVRQRLLLRGAVGGLATPEAGCVIERDHVGGRVATPPEDDYPGLEIGRVVDAQRLATTAVLLAAPADHVDDIQVAITGEPLVDRGPSENDDLDADPLFDVVSGTVLAAGDVTIGTRSCAIDRGLAHGLAVGDYVVCAGEICGRIERIGRWTSRVVPVEAVTELGVLRLDPETYAVTAFGTFGSSAMGASTLLVTRGRGGLVPRGLIVDGAAEGEVRTRLPHLGAEVEVFVFRYRKEWLRIRPRVRS